MLGLRRVPELLTFGKHGNLEPVISQPLDQDLQQLPGQDASRTPLTLLTEGQAGRIRDLERLVA